MEGFWEKVLEQNGLDLYKSSTEFGGELSTSEPIRIELLSSNGGLTVCGWDRPDFRITLHVSVRASCPEDAKERARELLVYIVEPARLLFDGCAFKEHNESFSVELFLPRELSYHCDMQTSNGGVRYQDLTFEELHCRSSNGSLTADTVSGRHADLVTSNGSVNFRGSFDQLTGRTNNGSIDLVADCPGNSFAELHSSNGSIRALVKDCAEVGIDLDVQNSIGSINIDLPEQHLQMNRKQVGGLMLKGSGKVTTQSPDYDKMQRHLRLVARTSIGSITINSATN